MDSENVTQSFLWSQDQNDRVSIFPFAMSFIIKFIFSAMLTTLIIIVIYGSNFRWTDAFIYLLLVIFALFAVGREFIKSKADSFFLARGQLIVINKKSGQQIDIFPGDIKIVRLMRVGKPVIMINLTQSGRKRIGKALRRPLLIFPEGDAPQIANTIADALGTTVRRTKGTS